MLDATIGILTWNSRSLLEQCLDSLPSGVNGCSCEVWIVDNASSDGTVEMLQERFPDVHVIENPYNRGVAPARNQILRQAKGRYVVFLDVDTCLLPGSISTLVKVMDRHPDAAVGGPKLVYGNGRLQLSCRPFPSILNIAIEGTFLKDWFPRSRFVKEYTMEDWDHGQIQEVDWMYGACFIVRRESLKRIGDFDEEFFYLYEDVDFCFRAKKHGFKVIYIPETTVVHFLEREEKGLFHAKIRIHVKSILRYLLKDRYGILG